MHKVRKLYQECYRLGNKIPKRDKFGLWAKVETTNVEILTLTIKSALQSKNEKLETLETARLQIEVLKQLIRLASEIKIITDKIYLDLQNQLQEISRMINGWLKHTKGT